MKSNTYEFVLILKLNLMKCCFC